MVRKTALLFVLLTAQLAMSCFAQVQESPTGPVILTISGAISVGNGQEDVQNSTETEISAQFDLAMLEEIGLTRIVTETPWTKGLISFEGVLGRDLLSLVNFEGSSLRASALDNYSVDIPVEDFFTHDVILATRIDGQVLRVRDNGPLWVIYPWSDNSNLKRPQYFARSIWQLYSLIVKKSTHVFPVYVHSI